MSDSGESTFKSLHRLVEHYTPDGTLGRLLLGGPALIFAPFLFVGSWTMLFGEVFLPLLFMSLFTLFIGIAAFPVGVMVLWPVYLSLIGNLDSPAEYAEGSGWSGETIRSPENESSPEAVLKRRYAAGELSRDEFEQRLDDVLGPTRRNDHQSRTDDAEPTFETSSSR